MMDSPVQAGPSDYTRRGERRGLGPSTRARRSPGGALRSSLLHKNPTTTAGASGQTGIAAGEAPAGRKSGGARFFWSRVEFQYGPLQGLRYGTRERGSVRMPRERLTKQIDQAIAQLHQGTPGPARALLSRTDGWLSATEFGRGPCRAARGGGLDQSRRRGTEVQNGGQDSRLDHRTGWYGSHGQL